MNDHIHITLAWKKLLKVTRHTAFVENTLYFKTNQAFRQS